MKRVQAACICQTLRFLPKEGWNRSESAVLVRQEVEQYKKNLERYHILHRIVEEQEQPDGSILVKIIQQYNASPVGNYLD